MTASSTITDIHSSLLTDGAGPQEDGTAIRDEHRINALLRMTPWGEPVRQGSRWAEMRSERLDERRSLYAIISRDDLGRLCVTAYTDGAIAAASWNRLCRDVRGREKGARLSSMDAVHLIGRLAVNENGAEFRIGGFYLCTSTGRIVIDLLDIDDAGCAVPGTECGIESLDGWTIC